MKKKAVLWFSVLLLAGFLFYFAREPGKEKSRQSLAPGAFAGEARQAEQLYGRLPKTLDTEEVRLCFRGEELACDRESNVWYLPVDMDCAQWEAGTFTAFGDEIRILPLVDYTALDKQEVVAEGRRIPLLAWKDESCASIQVVFTGVPVVRMETGADLDVDTVFAGSVVFYEACGREDWTASSAFEAHERGQTTRAFPKKGYRLNLISVTGTGVVKKNSEPVLGMRDSDSWIFYAVYSDGTKVRDRFNIELWNCFGASAMSGRIHMGTHMEYAELVVNGEYRGLYGILEPVDSAQLLLSDQEFLYKRTMGRELSTELLDALEPEQYLTALGMEIKGKEGCGSRADWQSFRRFLSICEAEDRTFSAETAALLDLENAADMWLYLQMIYGEDNIYKNMFFAFKKEQGAQRMYLVPWDVDLTWGNVYTDDPQALYTVFAPERAQDYLSWPFMDRMIRLDVGGIRSVIKERFAKLREGILSDESMQRLLEECVHQVQDSGAFARDAQRWPDSRHDGDYNGMRGFMEKRMKFLEKYMENMDEWIED